MTPLIHQRCLNHAQREAAAQCLECGHFFCRECITEHEDRVVCAACLRQAVGPSSRQRAGMVIAARAVQVLAGLFIAWVFFHLLGSMLVMLPDSFHEGTLWTGSWMDQP